MLHKTRRYFSRYVSMTGMHRSDYRQQLIFWRTLQDIGRSTGVKSPFYLCVPVRSSQNDDAGLGKLSTNRDDGVCAVGSGQPQVHERDVRPMESELPHRL